jgi:hypothetical protein
MIPATDAAYGVALEADTILKAHASADTIRHGLQGLEATQDVQAAKSAASSVVGVHLLASLVLWLMEYGQVTAALQTGSRKADTAKASLTLLATLQQRDVIGGFSAMSTDTSTKP